jgi:hypothetical protein
MPKNPLNPTRTLWKRNPAGNQWEFYRADTGYGQPKCTRDTQEIPRQQK